MVGHSVSRVRRRRGFDSLQYLSPPAPAASQALSVPLFHHPAEGFPLNLTFLPLFPSKLLREPVYQYPETFSLLSHLWEHHHPKGWHLMKALLDRVSVRHSKGEGDRLGLLPQIQLYRSVPECSLVSSSVLCLLCPFHSSSTIVSCSPGT